MRRYLAVLLLPIVLSACDSNTPAPASQQPAAEPAAPTSPASTAPAPLFGTWGVDAPACSNPIVIAETSFQGAENSCEITELADNGDGTFTASLSCQGEGASANERVSMEPIFGPAGEGVRLTYLDRGGDPVVVFRCPAPRAE